MITRTTRKFYFLTPERIFKTILKLFSLPVKLFVQTFSRTSLEVPLKSLFLVKN